MLFRSAIYIFNLIGSGSETSLFEGVKLLITNPSDFWEIICYFIHVGTWGISKSGGNVTGIILWVIWIGEIILLFVCFAATFHTMLDIPFVEKDNNWATKYDTTFKFAYFNLDGVSRSIESDPNALFLYPRLENSDAKVNYVSAELYRSQDGGLNYLTLSTHRSEERRVGKEC